MTRGQRLAVSLVAAAALLLLGRGFAILYAEHAWYAALGAVSVWRDKVESVITVYALTFTLGFLFAFLNLTMVRRSIVSLVVPAQVGNVHVGQEIPSSQLTVLAGGMSVCATLFGIFAAPAWTTLALWRSGVHFNDSDPYLHMDLGYYVSWLPFESALYIWAIVLFVIVVLLVVTLYALTPSLTWSQGRLQATTRARRHMTILGAMLVLLTAWGFRLDAYNTLLSGTGPDHLFLSFDYHWVIPASLLLSVLMLCASIVLGIAGWVGQTQIAFGVMTGVVVACVGAKVVLPRFSFDRTRDDIMLEFPYAETDELYTKRAFSVDSDPPSARHAVNATFLASIPKDGEPLVQNLPNLIYPGARGMLIESDYQYPLHGPLVGDFFPRLMTAWAEQNAKVLDDSISSLEIVLRHRDLRPRIAALAPIFAQSRAIGARQTSVGLVWIIDLYATSDHYPLSEWRQVGRSRIKYRHHVATAYVSAASGEVTLVRDAALDPIATAWFRAHPGRYLASAVPADIAAPPHAHRPPPPTDVLPSDSVYRAHIANIYERMRTALDSGNFRSFGDAFDSLKAAVGAR